MCIYIYIIQNIDSKLHNLDNNSDHVKMLCLFMLVFTFKLLLYI